MLEWVYELAKASALVRMYDVMPGYVIYHKDEHAVLLIISKSRMNDPEVKEKWIRRGSNINDPVTLTCMYIHGKESEVRKVYKYDVNDSSYQVPVLMKSVPVDKAEELPNLYNEILASLENIQVGKTKEKYAIAADSVLRILGDYTPKTTQQMNTLLKNSCEGDNLVFEGVMKAVCHMAHKRGMEIHIFPDNNQIWYFQLIPPKREVY